MIAGGTDALEQALAVYRTPGRLPQLRNRPLPDSMLRLLRIAAGDAEALAAAAHTTGESSQTLVDAAVLYIQQILFAEDADSYRLLGVRADAPKEQVKEHYHWLMRWLHPDRHPERWEVVYSDRVNRAWQTLRSAARRSAYDLSLVDGSAEVDMPAQAQQLRRNALAVTGQPLLSTQLARRLPHIVLGGLGLSAILVLSLLYYLRDESSIAEPAAQMAQDPPAASSANGPRRVASDANPLGSNMQPATKAEPRVDTRIPPAQPQLVPAKAMPPPPPLPAPRVVAEPAVKPAIPRMASNQSIAVAAGTNRDATGRRSRPDVAQPTSAKGSSINDLADHPPAAAAVAPSTAENEKSPTEAANRVSQSFVRAYVAGDLSTMMGLFSVDAVGNRGGVDTIAQDYDKLFGDTESRDLRLDRLAWTTGDDRMIGSGPFEAILRRRGASADQRVSGWITIDAKRINGHWRIERLSSRNVR